MRTRILLIALVALLALPAAAQACSLSRVAPDVRVGAADAAVYGEVLTSRLVSSDAMGAVYRYRLRVKDSFKGARTRTVDVQGSTNGAMCGIGRLLVGRRYGLLLHGRRSPWQVNLASLISRAELESARKALRRGD